MGGGISTVSTPANYHNLSPEQKIEYYNKFEILLASGKSSDEAIEILSLEVVTPNVVTIELTNLIDAINAAVEKGKTPLVVDRSADDKVNTFFNYQTVSMLDGKKMGLDQSMRNISLVNILDGARMKIVTALKFGRPLVIVMSTSTIDFANVFNDDHLTKSRAEGKMFFPLEIFKGAGRGLLRQEFMNGLFREEDKADTNGFAICKSPDTFHTVITSRFAPADFEDYLFRSDGYGLPGPKNNYEFIVIHHDADVELMI